MMKLSWKSIPCLLAITLVLGSGERVDAASSAPHQDDIARLVSASATGAAGDGAQRIQSEADSPEAVTGDDAGRAREGSGDAAPSGGGDAGAAEEKDPIADAAEAAGLGEGADQKLDRASLLALLYERLSEAQDKATAQRIQNGIEHFWLRSGSDTIDLLMERAAKLQQSGDVGLALRILESVTELAPEYSEGWNRRAFVFFSEGDYSRALADLQRTLSLDQRHFQAISGLATILRELGDKKAALGAYRKILEIHPHWESARKAEEELAREVEGQGI